MARKVLHPICYLALSPQQTAVALGVKNERIYDAILSGKLGPVFQLGCARRILVTDIERWVRDNWSRAKPAKRKSK
jgi:hypothetical protein